MQQTPVELIFSNIPKERRRKPQLQVEIIIPVERSPLVISHAGDPAQLHAVGLTHLSERRNALRFRLYPEDHFAKGPGDISAKKDDVYLRIIVRDVKGLLPQERKVLPLQMFGILIENIDSFTVEFSY